MLILDMYTMSFRHGEVLGVLCTLARQSSLVLAPVKHRSLERFPFKCAYWTCTWRVSRNSTLRCLVSSARLELVAAVMNVQLSGRHLHWRILVSVCTRNATRFKSLCTSPRAVTGQLWMINQAVVCLEAKLSRYHSA